MNFTLSKSNMNFKVYTVAEKPTAPGAENDISIISSVPMTNWIMSPEKPSGIPRNDGDVWIQYSTIGDTRNILKQNALMIATISAWQYVNGAWVGVTAMSYRGGEWVDWWDGTLYYAGDEYELFTGGFSGFAQMTHSNISKIGTLTKNTSSITISCTIGQCIAVGPNNKIDITSRSKLKLNVTAFSGQRCDLWISPVRDNTATSNAVASVNINSNTEFSLDVHSLTGEYYVFVGLWNVDGGTFSVTFDELHME